ncbi:MAG: solute carrier family 35 protein [archaeon]|nr:solute carrier family 35 protein [archaeon]
MEDTKGTENQGEVENTPEEKKDEKKRASDFPVILLYALIGLMILTGTCNSVLNKCLQKLESKGIAFEQHHFIITMGMFIGELMSIFPYAYIWYKKRQEGESQKDASPALIAPENKRDSVGDEDEEKPKEEDDSKPKLPEVPTNLIFALTASCDLCGTTLYTFALTFLTTSMYQMLRGFELFFVCLFSRIFLKNPIYRHQFLGIGTLFVGLGLCGGNAIWHSSDDAGNARNPVIGIPLMFISMLFVGTDYTLQEHFLHKYSVNPFQLVGFEGLCGSVEYLILLIILQQIHCENWDKDFRENICFSRPLEEGQTDKDLYSRLEDTVFAFRQLGGSAAVLLVFIGYICSIALYNIVGINLTKLVSSTARAIIDTARTVFIWLFFLIWAPVKDTKEHFYWMQFLGFLFLLAGSVIYNEIVAIPFFNLDYYTRENIAKRKLEEKDLEQGGTSDPLYNPSSSDESR